MEPSSEPSPPVTTATFPAAGEGHESHPSTTSSSLFPLFPLAASTSSASTAESQWLSNPSFSFDASSLNVPSTTTSSLPTPLSPSSDDDAPPAPAPAKYELVPSETDSDEERGSRRKERGRRKRRREKDRYDGASESRKAGVRAWAGSETKPVKDYYVDAKGDHDNLAFGSLYRMDVARYRSQSMLETRGLNRSMFFNRRFGSSHIDLDSDLDGLDNKVRAGGRYYSAKNAVSERNKGSKHLKLSKGDTSAMLAEDFVPLDAQSLSVKRTTAEQELEESWEDEILRRTREFNKMSREHPNDEKVWLAFAQFQDKVASTQPQKAARLQTTERKISILEKAVELNPDNEELLLCLLKSYGERDSTENLLGRWEQVLTKHPDSCKLWKQYLLLCQGEFSRFKVSEIRKSYVYAVQALSAACTKLCRQVNENMDPKSPSSSLAQLELGLVDIFVNLCRFEWQTGHRELATGLFQAQMEFSLFSPPLYLTTSSKQRLFEHFWNSGGARIGEDGALGWSAWLAKDEESRQNLVAQENSQEIETGGWSGWFDPSVGNTDTNESVEPSTDGNDAEDLDAEDRPAQDDVESLLKKLGIDVDAESNSEVKDAETWNRWATMELSRDNEQWLPLHEKSGIGSLDSGDAPSGEDNNQLSRVILFEDVAEFLFSLSSEEARFSLICQFIDFYGGKISRWTSTNSSSWLDRILSLEMISDDILEDLSAVSDIVNKNQDSYSCKLESLLGSMHDLSQRPGLVKFLRNAILLLLDVFPRNHVLEEAILVTTEMYTAQENSSSTANTSRALAKNLLKKDRQDFLLCGIYGRTEAMHGNIEQARKIFDMALLSTEATAEDLRKKVPILYLWYAEMEITVSTSRNNSDSTHRAIYILSCLGSNVKYAPFIGPISRPQVLRARQGFKEQIRSLRSAFASGGIKEESVALICSASLFESMTSGYSSGLEVIEDMLCSDSSHNSEFEDLWVYYIKLLQKNLNQLSLSRVWPSISQGMHKYPYNPKSYSAMLILSYLYSVSNNLRLTLDKCSQSRDPSIITLLFALSFEWHKAGSDNRIHSLFERALADDKLQKSVLLWRCYLAYEAEKACNASAARRVFFRAIHACPWLWLDGFLKLSSVLTLKELSDLQEVMRDKELNIRTDIYEILLQDETDT
ncbi:protein NRDE2 homolog isoform X3 [Panicum hallii]|uniref:protein NRDE2 homolog isoform X3 n=1 Tax=Panicum hallii TaxID=206008 RepID=UPI000DF4D545|nr:protein NRDE2 homolog isoform X3 [Panicum hallii]